MNLTLITALLFLFGIGHTIQAPLIAKYGHKLSEDSHYADTNGRIFLRSVGQPFKVALEESDKPNRLPIKHRENKMAPVVEPVHNDSIVTEPTNVNTSVQNNSTNDNTSVTFAEVTKSMYGQIKTIFFNIEDFFVSLPKLFMEKNFSMSKMSAKLAQLEKQIIRSSHTMMAQGTVLFAQGIKTIEGELDGVNIQLDKLKAGLIAGEVLIQNLQNKINDAKVIMEEKLKSIS